MIPIVSLEIQKILKRKFVLILLAIYCAILLFMVYAGNPNRYTPILTSEGEVLEGQEAVKYEKELAEKYDTLSDADVQEILADNARILEEYTDENQMIGDDYYRYANGFYGAVASVFSDENGNYNHLPADQVYPDQEGLMQGGFTNGMDMLLSFLASFLLLASFLMIVMISPVFAEEYTFRNGFTHFVRKIWKNTVCKGEDPGFFSMFGWNSCSDDSIFGITYNWIFWNGRILCGCSSLFNRNDWKCAV